MFEPVAVNQCRILLIGVGNPVESIPKRIQDIRGEREIVPSRLTVCQEPEKRRYSLQAVIVYLSMYLRLKKIGEFFLLHLGRIGGEYVDSTAKENLGKTIVITINLRKNGPVAAFLAIASSMAEDLSELSQFCNADESEVARLFYSGKMLSTVEEGGVVEVICKPNDNQGRAVVTRCHAATTN